MATIIRATCTDCDHDVELMPEGVHLFYMDSGRNHYYIFCCPCCFALIRRNASTSVVALLRTADVAETSVHVPLEIVEIEMCSDAPKLTSDDLLEFVLALSDWCGDDLV